MKKILALVLAVAMLASMGITAAAGAASQTGQGVVHFTLAELGVVPAYGIFCPVENGPAPATTGAGAAAVRTGGWASPGNLAFLNTFASLGVDFGHRDMPDVGTVLAIAAMSADNRGAGDIRRNDQRRMGVGAQAWVLDPVPDPPVMVTGNRRIEIDLGQFFHAGQLGVAAHQRLNRAEIALGTGAPATAPLRFPGGTAGVPIAATLTQQAVHGTAAPQAVTQNFTGAVFAFEWTAALNSLALLAAEVPSPNTNVQAVMTYTLTVQP